jgi:hypothetical protein
MEEDVGVKAVVEAAGSAKGLLEGMLATGRRAAGLSGPLGTARRAALDRIFASGETLRLQFPREDLGFSYTGSGALVLEDASDRERPVSTGLIMHSPLIK